MASELPAVRAKWMPPEVNEEAKLIESPAPHFTPRPQQSNPGYMRQYIMSDLERWRQLFREEARKCAAELRATLLEQEELRGRDVSFEPDIGFETEGSRKAEAETELLRSHVEELLRLNSSLRQATLDQLSSKEFGKLRGCVVDLTKEVQALMGAKRQEHPVEIAKVAADAASKALASAERQVMKNLNASLEAQQKVLEGRWKSEDERWSALDKEVASLREQTKLIEDVSAQALEGAGERMVEQLMARLEPLLETKLKTSGSGLSGGEAAQARATSKAAARSAAEEVTERFLAGMEPRFDLVLQEMKRGTGVEVGCLKALEKPMADLEESMKGFVKEAVEGEGELRRLQVEAMEAKAELTHCKQELEQSRNNFLSEAAETRILNSKLKELEAELAEAKGHVEEAAQRGGVRFLQQVKQVEGRGLISLDLSKCVLEIKKGMDFKAKKPTEAPVAQFTDESLATSALADASELVSMLKGARISVESHVKPVSKGADAFWEQLAEGRAELIRQHLAAKAEDAEIAAKGVPNRQGTNAVVVKIGLPSEK